MTLDTAAYEALYAKRADFVISFGAWEGIEAAERGITLRTFEFTDYGFPDFYQVVLACDRGWLAKDPAAAKAFVGATVRGFAFAAADPAAAADILVAQNPGVFDANPALPKAQRGVPGGQAPARRRERQGGHADPGRRGRATRASCTSRVCSRTPQGKPLTAPPDYGSLFTNDFLP